MTLMIIFSGLFSSLATAQMNSLAFDQAAQLFRSGNYAEAMDIYRRMANCAGSSDMAAQAQLLSAVATYLYLGESGNALGLLQKIRDDYPNSKAASDALFHMGIILYGQKKYSDAGKTFSNYITQYPKSFRYDSAIAWKTCADNRTGSAGNVLGPALRDIKPDTKIRVLIVEGAEKVRVGTDRLMLVLDSFSGKQLFRGKGSIVFSHCQGKLRLNHQSLNRLQCIVETDGPFLNLENTRLRGKLFITIEPDGLQVINHIPIEQYLYGTIPREMPQSWPDDALKAQAIASRTYALYLTGNNRCRPFDVEATTAAQVYGGYDAETVRTTAAVDATRKQVLTQDGRLIIAYFHSNSAGHTEDAKDVWQVEIPYLKGLPDKFSKNIPNGRWEYFLSYDEAAERLNLAGLNVGSIYAIQGRSFSPTGRVLRIAIASDHGTIELPANHFRCILDATQIKSTYFSIIPEATGVLLKGEGHGHGVGMSQWGANQMAKAGYSHLEILKHYYPGVELAVIGKI